ncbi:ABC transporter permease [Scopulibacillus cellulosilyticus]|uniref:ABC transporter permease n=1 Tax=Scopulibacillus cellulosilyticus TaxID=2665665 RepID=A0ABW2PWQ1_9BACL
MNKFWIVFSQTYFSKLKSKPFISTIIISIILIAVMVNLPKITSYFNKNHVEKVAVIDHTHQLFRPLNLQIKKVNKDIKLTPFEKGEAQAKKAVKDGKYKGYLILDKTSEGLPKASYYAMKLSDETVSDQIKQSLQQIKSMMATEQLGLNSQKLAKISAPVDFHKQSLDKGAKTEKEIDQARVLVYILVLLIYMMVVGYGSMIAQEIASEKSSRVMELIVSSVSPGIHMISKVVALALLGLTQYVIFFLTGILAIKLSGSDINEYLHQNIGLNHIPFATLIFAVIFFLLGYFLYATMFAVIGSLVNRLEEVGQAIMPVTMLIMIGFFLAIYGCMGNPESTLVTVTSYIPFFTPMMMFLRVGILSVPFWEWGSGILIMIVSIALLIWIGTRVYKGGVLMYQSSSVFKAMKSALKITKES